MRLGILLVFVLTSSVSGQSLPFKAKNEVDEFKKKLRKLNDEYVKSVAKARSELNLKLTEIEKDLIKDDKIDKAKLVEAERERLSDVATVEQRLGLEKAIVGTMYKWKKTGHIWRFEPNGTVVSLSDGGVMPWVALNDRELLLKNPNSEQLKILRFNDDRSVWEMLHMDKPKRNPDSFARKIR